MKNLKQITCWGIALKALADGISKPGTPMVAALEGVDVMKIVGVALQGAEHTLDTMPPEQARAHMLDLAQRLGIDVIEDADHAA